MSKILDEKLKKKSSEELHLWALRHTAEHVLHTALQNIYPSMKKAMGPATDEGYYHDFDLDVKVSDSDFPKIEKEMKRIIDLNLPMIQEFVGEKEARKIFKNNPYKLEWVDQIKSRREKFSLYKIGDIDCDLCSGPHVKSTGEVKAFKLLKVAGAYWHGDEKNKMLTRIYGTCFPTKEELDIYLWQQEEAKKRDHRVLGKKLDLFVIDENIGKGLPLLTPKGAIIRKQILDYEYQLEHQNGFLHVVTPHIARSELYKKTGHWQHYKEVMYESFGIDGDEYVLKPMNCPHHYMIYKSKPRSYRDLPIRLTEPGTCYRFEKTGELSGLIRVRALTIDDSHILMREDQIEDEFKTCIKMVSEMFRVLGLKNYYVRLSLPDPSDAVKYIADADVWKAAKDKLEKIVKDNHLPYKIAKGEASFYGPKLDYMVKDSIGREWQMSTLQLDLFMGKRLNLTYIDSNGEEKHPVILHRGLTGSIERTLAILIEHYAGKFPLWLSPVQISLIPIADRHLDQANKIYKLLFDENIRVEIDQRSESMQAKIRDATLQKVPYMGIIGDNEVQKSNIKDQKQEELYISIRNLGGQNLGQMTVARLLELLKTEIEKKL
ncbi:threonine--tRNA ligase [Candidatus Microgenomates bacterium]|nr:threonine--tRNA ligase [Candidatus Microgenomates bacterium]